MPNNLAAFLPAKYDCIFAQISGDPKHYLHHAEDADPGEEAQDTACKEDHVTTTIIFFNVIYFLPKDDSLSKKLSLLLMTVTDRVLVASLKMTSALY